MTNWCEDVSTLTSEEIVQSRTENTAWSKELRTRKSELVDNRLAKRISLDEYTAVRKVADLDAIECRRRAWSLSAEIAARTKY